jgi:hypothetical protein
MEKDVLFAFAPHNGLALHETENMTRHKGTLSAGGPLGIRGTATPHLAGIRAGQHSSPLWCGARGGGDARGAHSSSAPSPECPHQAPSRSPGAGQLRRRTDASSCQREDCIRLMPRSASLGGISLSPCEGYRPGGCFSILARRAPALRSAVFRLSRLWPPRCRPPARGRPSSSLSLSLSSPPGAGSIVVRRRVGALYRPFLEDSRSTFVHQVASLPDERPKHGTCNGRKLHRGTPDPA